MKMYQIEVIVVDEEIHLNGHNSSGERFEIVLAGCQAEPLSEWLIFARHEVNLNRERKDLKNRRPLV